jgi:peptide/nickel transport system substrate-binding protein
MRRLTKGARAGTAIAAGALALGLVASTGAGALSTSHAVVQQPRNYGKLPAPSGTPKSGGTVSIAESPNAGPNWIFPITPTANSSVYTISDFQNFSWLPVFFAPKGESPELNWPASFAKSVSYADANKKVTIHLKNNWKWSNGKPVTAKDIQFYIWLLKAAVAISPSNFGNYTPGLFPDNLIGTAAPNKYTLVLKLKKTYNSNFLELSQFGVLTPLPSAAWSKTSMHGKIIPFDNLTNAKKIYKFLAKQSGNLKSYSSDPLWKVVDGPYILKSFDASNDGAEFVWNTHYTGPGKPHIKYVKLVAFTSTQAEFNQLLEGKIDFGGVDFSNLRQVPALRRKGYNVWGAPDFGFSYIIYNFKDQTGTWNRIINQLYVRQALAHLQNETAVIDAPGMFDKAASPAYGPVPTSPTSPFTPKSAYKSPYPFSISKARNLMSSHGWKDKNGMLTCVKGGTGSGHCGGGITTGTKFSTNLIYSDSPAIIQQQDEAWVSNARKIGMHINLQSDNFNHMISTYNDAGGTQAVDNEWGMMDFGGFTGFVYPTMNEIFNTTGSYDFGGFSSKAVDQAIKNSEFSTSASAVKVELGLETKLQPGLFQPSADLISAWKKSLSGPKNSFASASQYVLEPNYWYFKK